MHLISWHPPVARQKPLGFRELHAWRMRSEIIAGMRPITISRVDEANHLFHSSDGLVTWESLSHRLVFESPVHSHRRRCLIRGDAITQSW